MSSGEKTEREVASRIQPSQRETAAPAQGTSLLSVSISGKYLTERKKESLFKNSPRLFRNLLDSRRVSEEKQRGGTELQLHHLVNLCEEFQYPPGDSDVTITHNSSYRIGVANSEDLTDEVGTGQSVADKAQAQPVRKNTLSSGEVTVIVHHTENIQQNLDFYGINRPNHKTVTNIFRFFMIDDFVFLLLK